MNNEKSNKLGTESIGKLLFNLAVPSITAQLVNMLYNIVDRIYIGHLPNIGSTALTGVGVTMPIILIIPYFIEDKIFAVFLAEPVSDFIAASVTVFMFAKNINRILSENENMSNYKTLMDRE